MSYFDREKNPYGIDKNAHYFVPLHPLEGCFGVSFTSSNTPEILVECKINEDRYKVDDGYKVTLESLDPRFGTETFYQSDFYDCLYRNSNHKIFKKNSDNEHVEYYSEREYLTDNVYLVLVGTQIVE